MPIRKTFTENNQIPISIVYKMTKGRNEELPDHLHDWFEMIYVYQGKGVFFIDQSFYELEPGDLILIPGNTIHRSDLRKEERVTSTALFFNPNLVSNTFPSGQTFLQLFNQAREKKEYRYRLEVPHRLKLEELLEELWQEEESEHPDRAQALALYLHLILLYLNRLELKKVSSGRQPEWLKGSLNYIEQNLKKPIELESLAANAAVSPTYFSRMFKQAIGLTVSDYLTTKRMIAAKELLKQSNETIQTIAANSGYQSMPHFYRTFKKNTLE